MLYVLGDSGACMGIDSNKRYSVWDSDDLSIENHLGSDISQAYKGGIKFGNLSKVSDRKLPGKYKGRTVLYVNKAKCDIGILDTQHVFDTGDIYCMYTVSSSNYMLSRITILYNNKVYTKSISNNWSKKRRYIYAVPGIMEIDGKKRVILVDMRNGSLFPIIYCGEMTKRSFRRQVALRGIEETIRELEDFDYVDYIDVYDSKTR